MALRVIRMFSSTTRLYQMSEFNMELISTSLGIRPFWSASQSTFLELSQASFRYAYGADRSITIVVLNGSQVASSESISLRDDDDDPKAIYAMIRHLYDLPYDQSTILFPNSLNTDLMFHVNVFEAADKYDVPSLRALVVDKIPGLMKQTWLTNQEEFCKAIRRLCAPDAVVFADKSLQASAASFCSTYISTLIKNDRFVQMLEEGEPFAGRLLTAVLKGQTSPLKKSPY